ncbi:Dynamitin-domain-containing protein [Coemansia spiralis]|nr:Dynamitin-domain-containing protein [Coemansia spiralis]
MSASVASKYSNLPDIDIDQPDVYETADVPDDGLGNEEQADEIPFSEDIAVTSIKAAKAAERFRVSAGDVDSKSALARYQKALFRTLQLESLSTDLEVVPAGASQSMILTETPEQRLRRLIYETQELQQQLAASGRSDSSNKKGGEQNVALMKLATGLHDELALLNEKARSEDTADTGSSLVSHSLWQRFENISHDTSGEDKSIDSSKSISRQRLPKDDAVSQFETRISALEKVLGASSAHPAKDAAVGHSLVDTVSRLRQQIGILADPHRVDGIQRRIKQTLVDLDRLEIANTQATKAAAEISEGRGETGSKQSLDPDTVKRINELYEKLVNIDSLIELAPATARRLQSLAKLHVEASDVVARIGRVEAEQGSIDEELKTMKEIATGLKSSMSDNSDTLRENIRHLDARIASLTDRISALSKK